MKQLVKQEPRGGNHAAPVIPNDLIPQYSTIVREKTTTTVTRERTTYTIAPICGACGGVQTRIVGRLFECLNESCPGHDPDGGASAIPLREEGKKLIDVEPIRRAA